MFLTAVVPIELEILLGSTRPLDNASLYRLLSLLQIITCVLVGDNVGTGFLVRRVAPSGEREEGDEKRSTRLQQSIAFLTA